MNVHITRHAEVRMQQRGVSRDVLGLAQHVDDLLRLKVPPPHSRTP
jgi:hypothetical protein